MANPDTRPAGGRGMLAAAAERVIVIDRLPDRLVMAGQHAGAETIDYSTTDVQAELRERTGGRGPDVCIRIARGELDTRHLATHVLPLDEAPRGYDGCVRAVFRPAG